MSEQKPDIVLKIALQPWAGSTEIVHELDLPVVYYLSNSTNGIDTVEYTDDLQFLFGPVIGGICGGLVALATIIGFCEYLRRRKTFHRLRMRFDPEYAHEVREKRAEKRKLGAVNVVDMPIYST